MFICLLGIFQSLVGISILPTLEPWCWVLRTWAYCTRRRLGGSVRCSKACWCRDRTGRYWRSVVNKSTQDRSSVFHQGTLKYEHCSKVGWTFEQNWEKYEQTKNKKSTNTYLDRLGDTKLFKLAFTNTNTNRARVSLNDQMRINFHND